MEKIKAHFYHIAYSEETWRSAPAGMKVLDNRANERPDWAEYWPIRRFLLTEALDENAFYAFLSPSFSQKTLIQPQEFAHFIETLDSNVDIATCSQSYDMRAVFRNVFEQAEYTQVGFMDLSKKVLAYVKPEVDLSDMVNTAYTGVFSNYFAAKPRFWRAWLAMGERIFAMAESPTHPCSSLLNQPFNYKNPPFQAKVFLIERMASLLLATPPGFVVTKFGRETLSMGLDDMPFQIFETMDMLKTLGSQGQPQLLRAFEHIQREILENPAIKQWKRNRIANDKSQGMSYAPSKGYEHWVEPPPVFAALASLLTPSPASSMNQLMGWGGAFRRVLKRTTRQSASA